MFDNEKQNGLISVCVFVLSRSRYFGYFLQKMMNMFYAEDWGVEHTI